MLRLLPVAVVTAAGALASSPAASVLPLPPMGFNNWARFMTNISEALFVETANAMTRSGLRAAGYNRINLDDAWSTLERSPSDSMVWDPLKFPRGLPWLASHLKSKGFIPGIYSDAGTLSCGGYPGALGYEHIDLDDFAAWGFRFLKMDGCNLPDGSEDTYHRVYERWHRLLAQSRTDVVFSDSAPAYFSGRKNLTEWYMVMGWAQQYGHMARHSADIQTYPDGESWGSLLYNYGQHVRLARFQRPGFFNDPDFLNVDHPSYTLDEKKSHFALWCVFSAPLLLSADIAALSRSEIEYLTNRRLIAVNQDRLVQQATLVSSDPTWDVLTKSLENGDRVVAFFNKGRLPADAAVSLERLGFAPGDLRRVRDIGVENLWTGRSHRVAVADGRLKAPGVPSHGTAVFRISGAPGPVTPTGIVFNTNSMNCLTEQESGWVRWAHCDGSDAQVWRVSRGGQVASLLRPERRIAIANGGGIATREPGMGSDAWMYHVSGNLIHIDSKMCLTEAADGAAVAAPCGYLLNEQVVSLPVGTAVYGS